MEEDFGELKIDVIAENVAQAVVNGDLTYEQFTQKVFAKIEVLSSPEPLVICGHKGEFFLSSAFTAWALERGLYPEALTRAAVIDIIGNHIDKRRQLVKHLKDYGTYLIENPSQIRHSMMIPSEPLGQIISHVSIILNSHTRNFQSIEIRFPPL